MHMHQSDNINIFDKNLLMFLIFYGKMARIFTVRLFLILVFMV